MKTCMECGKELNRKGLSRPNAACICEQCVRDSMDIQKLARLLTPEIPAAIEVGPGSNDSLDPYPEPDGGEFT